MFSNLDLEAIRKKYNQIEQIWHPDDKWNMHTKKIIERYILFLKDHLVLGSKTEPLSILNAGSGGNDYGLNNYSQIHVDIAEDKIAKLPNSLVANIERLPFADQAFDVCLCVGSVINYCNGLKAINEFGRVLRDGGLLLIEFESSRSYEFAFSNSYNKSATIVETFYNGTPDKTWVYGPEYILRSLSANKFRILNKRHFHLISPFVYRLTHNEALSARFSFLDPFARLLPGLRSISANIILLCQKAY